MPACRVEVDAATPSSGLPRHAVARPLTARALDPCTFSAMRTIRRGTALLLSLLVIQLTLATSGYACIAQDETAGRPHDGMVMGGEPASIAHAANSPSCDAVGPESPCQSTDSASECVSMGLCAPLLLNGERPTGTMVAPAPTPLPAPTLGLLSPPAAPELPPPRA